MEEGPQRIADSRGIDTNGGSGEDDLTDTQEEVGEVDEGRRAELLALLNGEDHNGKATTTMV
jgi:hypothetical protein